MGIPSFFRWITTKYKKTVVRVVEEKGDYDMFVKRPNPNGIEFDNFYIDMNGVVHNASHPEGKKAPETEEEIFNEITRYLERLVAVVRPRNILYLAIDGVAPRAKMNQQRSRRFRSSQEEAADSKAWFDPNCITPGTVFMERLSNHLKKYLNTAVKENILYSKFAVIFSDASIPGEGEHKIMAFIRSQRASPAYQHDMRHVLHGLDADLIMLALATHEPRFHILREDVFLEMKRKFYICKKCKQKGHYEGECGILNKQPREDLPLVLFNVGTLREYLSAELKGTRIAPFNLERAIDDWVFLCFLVGNDFLPHIPSLEIRENAIDRIVRIYLKTTTQYLTKNGHVHLERLTPIFRELGKSEEEIFRNRRAREERMQNEDTRKRKNDETTASAIEKEKEEPDNVRFHEDGFRERYYEEKLGSSSPNLIAQMVSSYVEGLSWIMKYYYRGCPSWMWYYPFHYSPLVSDIAQFHKQDKIFFEQGKPFKPFEQLMAVFPAKSRGLLPEQLHHLFVAEDSKIKDFYPENFKIDMNGKKVSWLGVVILPFIEEDRLLEEMKKIYPEIGKEDLKRNEEGNVYLYAKEKDFATKLGSEVEETGNKNIFVFKEAERKHVWGILSNARADENVLVEKDCEDVSRMTDIRGGDRRTESSYGAYSRGRDNRKEGSSNRGQPQWKDNRRYQIDYRNRRPREHHSDRRSYDRSEETTRRPGRRNSHKDKRFRKEE
eukprot:GHVN01072360.1.p1 GENE.GHVN01072360.1~~GHVN01072360.1.p1  ORF type:complete len:720 (+),score=65.27 GHVN01072360.1:1819-3978(+)